MSRSAPTEPGVWSLPELDRMWHPATWFLRPVEPYRGHYGWEILVLVLGGYANLIANRFLDDFWHLPFNLGVMVVALAIARRAGVTWSEMGLRTDRVGRGLVVGGIVVGIIVVGMAGAVAIPFTREVFYDDRVIGAPVWRVLADALVRIPLATALFEEILFRGIVFGMFLRRTAPFWAATASAFFFGLWHILPTLETVEVNPAGELFSGVIGLMLAAAGAVVGTMVAGYGFTWLRLAANSTVAPWLAHIGTNSTALVAALVVVHWIG